MSKIVTYSELKEHTKKESVWLLISGKGASRLDLKTRGRDVILIRPL